jgi:selenophosphate synthase
MRADLSAMLQGATQVLREDGCSLVGGHSGEADEAALGFAVSGLAEPEALTRKSGLRPGDALILTKPLGTGSCWRAYAWPDPGELARRRDQVDAHGPTRPRHGSCGSTGSPPAPM